MRTKLLLMLVAVSMAIVAGSASATVLVYEPFDYPDAALNGQGGALGTTGTWTTNDTGFAEGWWCHPGGATSGAFVAEGVPNVFDGTVDNLPTSGGFVGMPGPEDRGLAAGTDTGTGNLDANIGLDPSVTATFQSGTTTWFSYVGAHAWDRNEGSPTFMICTDPTVNGTRSLTMQNSGNGIGGVGGPTRANLFDVYPHYFSGGVHHQTPGGYLGGVFGGHDGIVPAFDSLATSDGALDEVGQPRTQTMAWQVSDDNGFGAANIVVGKIEWDADTGGEDIISVVRFLETDELSEAAFDALVAALPPLSSANWASNKPDLDQSQFDTLNISSLKFYVDEIRIGTSFIDAVSGNGPTNPSPYNGQTVGPSSNLPLSWINADPNNPADSVYVDVWFGTDPNDNNDFEKVYTALEDANYVPVDALDDGTYYWQVISYIYGDPGVVAYDTNGNDPNKYPIIGGSMWKFHVVGDVPPTVEIVTTPKMTWSGKGVPLDSTVTDDAISALTIVWIADDDSLTDPNLTIEILNADQADATVTITKTVPTDDVVTVTMTVIVGDGTLTSHSDSVEIDVYDDACHVARVGLGRSAATDFNNDCITALEDLAAAAAAWFNDYSSTGPVGRP